MFQKTARLKPFYWQYEKFRNGDFNQTRAIPGFQELLRCVRSFRAAKFMSSTVTRFQSGRHVESNVTFNIT